MKLRRILHVCGTSALLATAALPIAAQPNAYYVFDGTNIVRVPGDPRAVNATEWAAFYFKRGASTTTPSLRWGTDTKKTPTEVLKTVEANQKFERTYEKWCGCGFGPDTFFNVLAPVAITSASPRLGAATMAALDKAHSTWDELTDLRDRFNTAATLAGESKLPTFGSGPLTEFAKTLHDTLDRYLSLSSQIGHYADLATGTFERHLDEFFSTSAILRSSVDPAFKALPTPPSASLRGLPNPVRFRATQSGFDSQHVVTETLAVSPDGRTLYRTEVDDLSAYGGGASTTKLRVALNQVTRVEVNTAYMGNWNWSPTDGSDITYVSLSCGPQLRVYCVHDDAKGKEDTFAYLIVPSQSVDATIAELRRLIQAAGGTVAQGSVAPKPVVAPQPPPDPEALQRAQAARERAEQERREREERDRREDQERVQRNAVERRWWDLEMKLSKLNADIGEWTERRDLNYRLAQGSSKEDHDRYINAAERAADEVRSLIEDRRQLRREIDEACVDYRRYGAKCE